MYQTISPDHYDGMLEEWEERLDLKIEDWEEEDYIDFVKEAEGIQAVRAQYHPRFGLIQYWT